MTDHADPVDSQQRGTTLFTVIVLPRGRLQGSHRRLAFGVELGENVLSQRADQEFGHPLADLQHHVAHKPLANQYVRFALVQTSPLDVADITVGQSRLLEQCVSLAVQLVPLAVLATNVHQPHPRRLDTQDFSRIDHSHHRVLQQVLGPSSRIGSDVNQYAAASHSRQCHRDPRATDSGQK